MQLTNATAIDLSQMLRNGDISLEETLEATYREIEKNEKKINAYITLAKEAAFRRAKILHEIPSEKRCTMPLFGVPIAVKDNICTRRILTTCGSKMLNNYVPPYSATVIERLEEAGAIVIGKTNMDEFAMGNTSETSAYGAPHNPHNLNYVTGGSSGGSAATVALGSCPIALGTDTGGSIRLPASYCGIVGIKPTYGSVSRYGMISYASSFEQIGPMAKTVSDCVLMLEVMSGEDRWDATSLVNKNEFFLEFGERNLQDMRIGVPFDYQNQSLQPEVKKALEDTINRFASENVKIEEFSLGLAEYAVWAYYIIACAQASSNLARFDGVKYGYRTRDEVGLEELYRRSRTEGFGHEVKKRIMLGTFVLSEGFYEEYYIQALKVRRLIKEAYDEAFRKYDVLILPVSDTTAPELGSQQGVDSYQKDVYTVGANLAGIPAMSVPIGMDEKGLPIGVQIMADKNQEKKMLRVAYVLEQMRGEVEWDNLMKL